MAVTNTIRENVYYDNEKDWYSVDLTNDEIIEKLNEEKKKAFLSFAYRSLDHKLSEEIIY